MKKIFTFGEIMLRVSPYNQGERIRQSSLFRIEPGGSEANVAVALAQLGHEVGFVSRIPDNDLKKTIIRYLRSYGVDISLVSMGGSRLGAYWTESGCGPRPGSVIYDRSGSAFAESSVKDFDCVRISREAAWFHTSGINPALSEKSARTVSSILGTLGSNVKISVDLNYRSRLWQWVAGKKAKIESVIRGICSRAFLVTANETDLADMLGYKISGKNSIGEYKSIAGDLFKKMRRLNYLAVSLRTSHSASDNGWQGLLFVRGKYGIDLYVSPKYEIRNIVDRIGSGDSFSAGIIHGILSFGEDSQHIVDFAAGLSALKHTVLGDASQFDERDVEAMLKAHGSGKIIR